MIKYLIQVEGWCGCCCFCVGWEVKIQLPPCGGGCLVASVPSVTKRLHGVFWDVCGRSVGRTHHLYSQFHGTVRASVLRAAAHPPGYRRPEAHFETGSDDLPTFFSPQDCFDYLKFLEFSYELWDQIVSFCKKQPGFW